MNSLLTNIKKAIADNISAKFLVAVSGGPDSVALLHAMYKLQCSCAVAHCNFHLRGEESDSDALLVKKLAVTYGFTFHSVGFDTINFAKDNHLSIEMAARRLRYDWFDELVNEYKYDFIAIAHNANDNVETFFLNLLRGTGIKGLCGIPEKRNNIIRPMIDVTRDEVMDYISQNNLEYHIDKTNNDTVYTRNFIRHNILPQFISLNPSFLSTMLSTQKRLSNISDLVDDFSNTLYSKAVEEKNDIIKLNLSLLPQSNARREVLFKWLSPFGFSSDDIATMADFEKLQPGKHFFSDNRVALIDRNEIIIAPKEDLVPDNSVYNITSDIHYPINLILKTIDINDFILDKNPDVACLDADKCKGHFTLRHWKKGDFFYPFGSLGKKKLSDFFSDSKLSLIEKNKVWLFCVNDEIAWVVGMRISGKFALTSNTKKVLKISLN